MAINWDDINLDEIVKDASIETDTQLVSRISSLTKMTDEEVKELFPNPTDAKKLVELMKIVKSSDSKNTKINKIVSNAEEFGGIVVALLGKFV